ncbi:MAG: hypothetical protein ACI8Y7_000972 [Candidatus Woesearchaeota archaeon]|jgi:hypothetical protein
MTTLNDFCRALREKHNEPMEQTLAYVRRISKNIHGGNITVSSIKSREGRVIMYGPNYARESLNVVLKPQDQAESDFGRAHIEHRTTLNGTLAHVNLTFLPKKTELPARLQIELKDGSVSGIVRRGHFYKNMWYNFGGWQERAAKVLVKPDMAHMMHMYSDEILEYKK